MKGKKKPPKDLIERERERERERARVHFFEKERERETDQREKEEQGFGVSSHWLNPPLLFMDSIFSFYAQNFLVWIHRPSADLLLFVCYLCSHIFSTMNMVELLKKIEERGVCIGVIRVGGGHQGFWLMGKVVFCGGVKFWVSD